MENFDQNALMSLLSGVRCGEDAAFERLLSAYRPLVGSSVRRFMARCPGADEREMEQEATLALYRAALRYDSDKKVTFGLFAEVCIHHALTSRFLRNRQSVCSLEEWQDDAQHTPAAEDVKSGEERLIEQESLESLRCEIKGVLSELEYSVFIRYAGGEKAANIAKELHMTVKAVGNARTRALRKLRILLGE